MSAQGKSIPGPTTLVVVPCYNEADRLPVASFDAFLADADHIGFVLVDDGSTDQTLDCLQGLASRHPERVTVLAQQPNRGKAEAVRAGLKLAMGRDAELVGYWDADLATPLEAIERFVVLLKRRSDVEVVLGARVGLLGHDIRRRPARHYTGRVFATAASAVLALPVYDTQCGAKLMRNNPHTRAAVKEPFDSRWIFDVELLARFQRAGGTPQAIYELPLERWHDVGTSKVKPVDYLRAIGEMIRIYRRYRLPARYRRAFDAATAPFVRYAGAGTIGTGAHYLVLLFLVEALSMSATVATVLGALAGALLNYVLNYHVTFASKARHAQTLPRFLLVACLGAGINGIGMETMTRHLLMHYVAAQVVCTLFVLVLGYGLNRVWTFRRAKDRRSQR